MMDSPLPPSKLLPATIAVTSVALAVKVLSFVMFPPSPGALWATTSQVALTASVISPAHAETPQPGPPPPSVPQPSLPQPSPPPSAGNGASQVLPADPAPAPSGPPAMVASPPRVDAGDATTEITLHRSQLEERELRVTQREAAVAAMEKRLTERVSELRAIQTHLESLEASLNEHDETKWTNLVKLYEGMRPREAASIFNGLDKPVLLELLGRMKPAKAAPVVALMEPANARQVTAALAARRAIQSTIATN